MHAPLYTASHRAHFEVFVRLVDDTAAQTAAILDSATWHDVDSLLSIGGGKGVVEASLLRNAPCGRIWYLPPSREQCRIFRRYMQTNHLLERVADTTRTTFQHYNSCRKFDRIVSMFSWYFIGCDEQWLIKLLDLLTPNGTAYIVLPNSESIFADFIRALSPDMRMTLVGDEIIRALQPLKCIVEKHNVTKWLALDDLFDGDQLSDASLKFAAFVAVRPTTAFTPAEKKHIADMLNARRTSQGVPLIWDLVIVKPAALQTASFFPAEQYTSRRPL